MAAERTLAAQVRDPSRRRRLSDRQLLLGIIDMVEEVMADLSGLDTAVAGIETVDQNVADELKALGAEVAGLKAGQVSQDQIDAVANRLNTSAAAVQAALDATKAADQPPPATP